MARAHSSGKDDLSPMAHSLLRELNGEGEPAVAPPVAPPKPVIQRRGVPIFLRPVDDPRISAFAEMLNHLNDAAVSSPIDTDRMAVGKKVTGAPTPVSAGEVSTDDEMTLRDKEIAGDITPDVKPDAPPQPKKQDAALFDTAFDEEFEDFKEFDEIIAKQRDINPQRKSGFWARFRRAASVTRMVGVKNATAAYDAQSTNTLLPYTIARGVLLLLVAAVPPMVNLVVIQPQISNNNRKLTEMRTFEAKAKEDERIANNLDQKIILEQQTSQRLFSKLSSTESFESLFNSYTDALQRYGIVLNSYNLSSNAERTLVVSDKKLEVNVVVLELEGRYDVYSEIRRVFVKESKQVKLIEETLEPIEGTLNLKITSKLLVSTQGEVE